MGLWFSPLTPVTVKMNGSSMDGNGAGSWLNGQEGVDVCVDVLHQHIQYIYLVGCDICLKKYLVCFVK